MDKKAKNFAKGAAIGVAAGTLAGALAGILLSPKSGKETRKDISDYVHKIKDEIAKKLEKMGEFTREKYNEVSAAVIDSYQKAKKISAGQAEKIKRDLDRGFDEVKKAVKKN